MKHGILATLALVLLAACATPQPRTDADPSADFARLHRYAWLADDPLFQPGDGDKPLSLLNRRRVVEAIEATLASRGFEKASSRETADFTIAYGVGTRERLSGTVFPDTLYRPWNWGWPYYGHDMGLNVSSDIEGRLSIDVLDATKKPIWHGVSADVLGAADLERSGVRAVRSAQSVMEKFPPR
ncbi:MAG: hypothetical protein RLZZ393_1723 [Pseudomonadota bacterium]|jgi:hypothetical protein